MEGSFDVVVIGAGQAGLAVSYHLTRAGLPHVVLERGDVGETWRSQRWDSFHLNTPNWANGLPGLAFDAGDPDGFGHRDDVVSYFRRYVETFDLPVRPRTAVTALEKLPTGDYGLQTGSGALRAKTVVLATGAMTRPRVPAVAAALPDDLLSISAGGYRSPSALPSGGVLVVGSGQSGCQIAEDLLAAGRRVFLCASRVGRLPRVYRGRDTLVWWREMGFLDTAVQDLENPADRFAAQPQVSGTHGGHTVSLQSLARDGATLLGRVEAINGARLTLRPDLPESIAFADDKSRAFKAAIDEWIEREALDAEPAVPDPGEPSLPDLKGSDGLEALDLRDAGIGTVIWCTGFDADWSWVGVDVFEEGGRPRHDAGITESPGLYFVGHPWLSKRSSGILLGVSDDAARIVDHIRDGHGRVGVSMGPSAPTG